ncbi:MAG: dihydropteroate synthase [Pseudomonadota bacterium]|nr:dihydropteroate synthase [Pseudomonadota bacterium]
MLGTYQCINPVGLLSGAAASKAVSEGVAFPLAGSEVAFLSLELFRKLPDGDFECRVVPASSSNIDLTGLTEKRAAFGGVGLNKPILVGILNVTPDSFSDGGDFWRPKDAISRAIALVADGADIVEIGAESTRPGAAPLEEREELERLLPVVEATVAEGIRVSVDTRRANVMKSVIDAGVCIINDVTALTWDPESIGSIASSGVSVVLMHMQGNPRTMQNDPKYNLASAEIYEWLSQRVEACVGGGIPRERIAVDPGFGFGKTIDHNKEVLDRVGMFHGIGCALSIGISRKSFLGTITGARVPKQRVSATIAATIIALCHGVQIHRVHDVAAVKQAIDVWNALTSGY